MFLGVVDKQFQFRNELDLKTWLVTSDRDNEEGDSHCDLKINQNGKGLFSGNLCLDVPKDGRISKTGYCNMRTIRYKVRGYFFYEQLFWQNTIFMSCEFQILAPEFNGPN